MDDEALVDIEARRVLADAQMRAGDPRGELFALQDALARGDASIGPHIARLLRERHDELYGPMLAPLVRTAANPTAPIEITWRLGLATDWVLHDAQPRDSSTAFADPLAKQLRRLEVISTEPVNTVAHLSNLRMLHHLAGTLRVLEVHAAVAVEDLGRAIGSQPELVELVVAGPGDLGRLDAPKLARLEAYQIGASSLTDSELPALRTIAMHGPRPGRLVAQLARWPSLRGVRRLSLIRAQFNGAELERFVAHARAFEHLELLDLSHNGLDRARVRDARDAIPGLQIEPMSLGAA